MHCRNCGGFGKTLLAVAQDKVKCSRPERRIWFCALGHSAKPITKAQKHTEVFLKLAISFKKTVMIKSVCIKTVITRAYTTQVLILGVCK
jgi:hypothetical protein